MLAIAALVLPHASYTFERPFRVQDESGPIRVEGGHAVPLMADYDGDGSVDLLVGESRPGRVRAYRNVAFTSAPKFASLGWVEAGGIPAQVRVFGDSGFTPQLADLDGDGIDDLLSGEATGRIFCFRGLGEGTFAPGAELLRANDKPVSSRPFASLAVTNWDRDGDVDLLVGEVMGEVRFHPNEGPLAPGVPAFPHARRIEIPGPGSVNVGSQAGVSVCDWDGDGILDLIVGVRDGSVRFFRGQGGSDPVVERGVELVSPVKAQSNESVEGLASMEAGIVRSQQYAKPCTYDWNGDGRLDLLVGDYGSRMGPDPSLSEAVLAEREQLRAQRAPLQEERARMYARFEAQATPAKPVGMLMRDQVFQTIVLRLSGIDERLSKLEAPRLEYGWVWVYLRKGD